MEADDLTKKFIVRGQLRQPDGSPLSGIKVRIYNKGLRTEQLLGKAITDEKGNYEIKYDIPSADLIVRAGPEGKELAASDVKFHAGPEETLDLRVSRQLRRSPSEFERLSKDLELHLKEIKIEGIEMPNLVDKLSDLKKDEIGILSGKMWGERQKIEQMTSAARLQMKAKKIGKDLPFEVFYALARQGITIDDLPSLLKHRMPAIRRALESSIDDNILPEGTKDKLDSIIGDLQSLVVREALRLPDDPKQINAGALFAHSRMNQSAQERIIALAADHEGKKEEFWERVADAPEFKDGKQLEEARFTLQLAALTAYHLPLVRAVQEIRQEKPLSSIRDLAQWDEDDWLKLVKIAGVPEDVPGESQESKAKAYAAALQREVELAFPTDAIKAQISRNEPQLWEEIKPIFDARPDFNILTDSIDLLSGEGLPKAALQETKRLQRLARVNPHYKSIKALKDMGINSSYQITTMSEAAFRARFSEALGGEFMARATYRKAYFRSSMASHLRSSFGRDSVRTLPRVIPPMWDDTLPDAPPTPEEPVMATNWSDYFGSPDVCECHHDSSVLGPAAYLVDLLQFLDKETVDGKGLSMLLAPDRRPDIEQIILDINNTETPLPYIDLVNEILEQAVANRGFLSARQTTWKKEELAANPEHVLREAYNDVLSHATYPWNLPFDLNIEESRLYLKHLGTSRHALMEAFYSGPEKDPLQDERIAAEYIHLSSREWCLISGSSSYKPWDLWGLKEDKNEIEIEGVKSVLNWLNVLSHPSKLLERAEITFEDLKDLLLTNFINRYGLLNIEYDEKKCSLATATIIGLADDPEATMRLCLFVRLWRCLEWDKKELDMALKVFRDSTEKVPLLSISHLQRLKDQLDTPLMDILTFYADLDQLPASESSTAGPHMLESVFLNRKIIRPGDDGSFEQEIMSGGSSKYITEFLPQVMAALGLNADDILHLLKPPVGRRISGLGHDATKLTCKNLSRLYRISRLCHATQLKIIEYTALIDLTGIDPMVLNPNEKHEAIRRTLAFLAELEYIRNSEFTILELHALLGRGSLDESANISLRQNTEIIQQLRDGIKLIAADQSLPNNINDNDRKSRKKAFIKQQLSQLLQLDATITEKLLENWIDVNGSQGAMKAIQAFLDPEIEGDNALRELNLPAIGTLIQENYAYLQKIEKQLPFDKAYQTLNLLKKIAFVLKRLDITYAEARHLFTNNARGWLDLSSLPLEENNDASLSYAGWKRLTDVCRLRDELGTKEPYLFDLFDLAEKHLSEIIDSDKPEDNPFAKALLERIGWDSIDFVALINRFNYGVDDFRDERAFLRIEKCFRISRRLGVTIEKPWQMIKWADLEDPSMKVAASIKRAVRAKYVDDQQWDAVASPLQNALRERKRAALAGFLTGFWNWKPEQIYSHFLIDTEMSSCMLTSRIVQAISSIQLFVQRIFLGIEIYDKENNSIIQFYDSASASRQWAWMKNYRVWEANRKVFLFPENWIEPELRDDKSPFFKDLENELRQSEISYESTEKAYLNYLQKLDVVSNLEIIGYYSEFINWEWSQDGSMEKIERLHVFGRTRSSPQVYYYRYRNQYHEWSAWEKVNLDIESDYLLPIVWNGRLYLFWPIFKETIDKPSLEGQDKVLSMSYWTIQIAYSYYWQGNWITKKVSKDVVIPKIDVGITINNHLAQISTFEYSDGQIEKTGFEVGWEEKKTVNSNIYTFEKSENDGLIAGSSFVNPLSRLDIPENNKNLFTFEIQEINEGILINVFYVAFSRKYDKTVTITKKGKYNPETNNSEYEKEMREIIYSKDWIAFEKTRSPKVGSFLIDISQKVSCFSGMYFAFGNISTSQTLLDSMKGMALFGTGCNAQYWIVESENQMFQVKLWKKIFSRYRIFFPANLSKRSDASQSMIELFYDDDNVSLFIDDRKTIKVFYHPFISEFIAAIYEEGVEGLLKPPKESKYYKQQFVMPVISDKIDVGPILDPNSDLKTEQPGFLDPHQEISKPRMDITFNTDEAYSLYNWELFFHIPLLIADRLCKNQQFEESMHWFHYIFDPLDIGSADDCRGIHSWQIQPFYEICTKEIAKNSIEELMQGLAAKEGDVALQNQIESWRKGAFKPHLLARLRITPYMKTVVMKYLDNLFAWADQLFRRYTIESINEATQLYILGAEILGPRPQLLPPRKHNDHNYSSLKPYLDEFSNLLEDVIPESSTYSIIDIGNLTGGILELGSYGLQAAGLKCIFPSAISHKTSVDSRDMPTSDLDLEIREVLREKSGQDNIFAFALKIEIPESLLALNLPPAGLYFCIPQNDKLLGYWDTLADRLFKIRHCLNIEGQSRELPLFQPTIDPALLVKAAAAGVDFSNILNDLSMPFPRYRFMVLSQKTTELCQEVKALGSAILAALEKRDAEELSLLRSDYEVQMLEMVREVREQQIKEAHETLNSLNRFKELAEKKQNFNDARITNSKLVEEITDISKLNEAKLAEQSAASADGSAADWGYAPNISFGINVPPGQKSFSTTTGGMLGVNHFQSEASKNRSNASVERIDSEINSKVAFHRRRVEEWTQERDLAEKELKQIDKQIAAAEIRIQIAEQELMNHEKQIENAKSVDEYMRSKFTNQELYDWMVGQISAVYFQSYQLAYDMAKRVERAYQFELGREDTNFIHFGYWDSLKKGLIAGDKLMHDLKRVEVAYLEQNERLYEITKNISLVLHDPMALITLKETGMCDFCLDESLFDADYPGHYMRRIKSVSLTIPCVTGPYTSINCKLTLQSSEVRMDIKNEITDDTVKDMKSYPKKDETDTRFITTFVPVQYSIVTSHAQNDSGMFELNFRDERYLPFEGAGVISHWLIEMDKDCNAFDFNTISDIVIKLNYTSKDGGERLREVVKGAMEKPSQSEPRSRLFSMKHEFPNEWYAFLHPKDEGVKTQTLEFELSQERFPFQFRGKEIGVESVDLFLLIKDESIRKTISNETIISMIIYPLVTDSNSNAKDPLTLKQYKIDDTVFVGVLYGNYKYIKPKTLELSLKLEITEAEVKKLILSPIDSFTQIRLNEEIVEDLIILCHYSAK